MVFKTAPKVTKRLGYFYKKIVKKFQKLTNLVTLIKFDVNFQRKKLVLQTELLKREIDQCLLERDKAVKESHDLRSKVQSHLIL